MPGGSGLNQGDRNAPEFPEVELPSTPLAWHAIP